MDNVDFSQPMRQSSKGILVIFGFNLFQFFKKFFVALLAIGFSLMRKKSLMGVTTTTISLFFVGLLIIILVVAILKYLNFKFHLTKNDFHLSRGIINKDNTIIPKSKIQNVYIKQNFLQQIINVVSVNIETAGDKKSEIEISALDRPTALLLKDKLFNKDSINLQQVDEQPIQPSHVYFKISMKRLLLAGLSQNHLRSFGIIAAFVIGLYYQFRDFIENLNLSDQVEDFITLDEAMIANLLLTNLIILFFVLLISVLFSIVKLIIVNFNLQVIEHQKTVEINKGLFNKVSLILTPSRIQNLIIKTNRVKRYFGLHTLYVKQTMVNQKQQKNFNIIALERPQVDYLIEKLIDNYSLNGERYKPRPYYMRILALRMLIFTSAINLLATLFFGYEALWANCIVIPIATLFVYISYKKAYYIISEDFVTLGSGFVDTVTNILEIHKIQAVKLRQSIFQKRRKIASVIIFTASKSVTIPYVNESEAKSIYDYLLFRVESQAKDWM